MGENDKVSGDNITVGNISGSSGVAIGRGASSNVSETRNIKTDKYIEGDDKSHHGGVHIEAHDQAKIDISGNIAAGNINIGTDEQKEELKQELTKLDAELSKLAADHAKETQKLEKRVTSLVKLLEEEEPDEDEVESYGNLVIKAADKLAIVASAATAVVPLATNIVNLVQGMVG